MYPASRPDMTVIPRESGVSSAARPVALSPPHLNTAVFAGDELVGNVIRLT
jgi:hypothetical protein